MSDKGKMRVMFVCHGNICRSPMAEFILRTKAERAGVASRLEIASSATSDEEIYSGVGEPVYPPARRELSRHGISCEGKRAVQLKAADRDRWDLFVCMDSCNLKNATGILGEETRDRCVLLLDYTGEGRDVADPWYSNRFDIAYSDIERGCEALLAALLLK